MKPTPLCFLSALGLALMGCNEGTGKGSYGSSTDQGSSTAEGSYGDPGTETSASAILLSPEKPVVTSTGLKTIDAQAQTDNSDLSNEPIASVELSASAQTASDKKAEPDESNQDSDRDNHEEPAAGYAANNTWKDTRTIQPIRSLDPGQEPGGTYVGGVYFPSFKVMADGVPSGITMKFVNGSWVSEEESLHENESFVADLRKRGMGIFGGRIQQGWGFSIDSSGRLLVVSEQQKPRRTSWNQGPRIERAYEAKSSAPAKTSAGAPGGGANPVGR